ncbi:MAG TPA: hypothetical protein VF816_11215 [Rhodocyclaceae bacterium]
MKKLLPVILSFLAPFAAFANTLTVDAGELSVSSPWAVIFQNYNGVPAQYTGIYKTGLIGTVNADEDGIFSATYLGSEASDNNRFSFTTPGGASLTKQDAVGKTISASVKAGVVGFQFIDSTANDAAIVINGKRAPNYASFAILDSNKSVTIGTNTMKFDYILGFNDGYRGDADFDDFVVGVKLKSSSPQPPAPVPLPAAAWLFGSAVIGFVAVSNRRKV